MLTIVFAESGKWPLVTAIDNYNLTDCSDVKSITLEGEALLLAQMELVGLPMPRYINEWQDGKVTWYWTDAQFIAANLVLAYKINKEATRGNRK